MGAAVGKNEVADKAEDRGHLMKAVVQEGYGSADVLHLRDIPRPALMEGRVLVRMRAASVNALDWHSTHGGLLLEIVGRIACSSSRATCRSSRRGRSTSRDAPHSRVFVTTRRSSRDSGSSSMARAAVSARS